MKPNATIRTEHQSSPNYIRALIKAAGLSQRGAARQIGVNERTMRNYCKHGKFPYIVQFAMECLARERAESIGNGGLKEGVFYWIIPVRCPDIDEEWMEKEQPARYIGNDMFIMMGSDEPWPASWVGCEIQDINLANRG